MREIWFDSSSENNGRRLDAVFMVASAASAALASSSAAFLAASAFAIAAIAALVSSWKAQGRDAV